MQLQKIELQNQLATFFPDLCGQIELVKCWTEPKIKDLGEDQFELLFKKVIAEIIFITGGKLYSTKTQEDKMMYNAQVKTLKKFISEYFNFFSFAEVIKAFYMNNAGQFKKIYSHYGRELNIEFIGEVLSAYKEYKQEIFTKHGWELVKLISPDKQLPAPDQSSVDWDNVARGNIEECYQRFIKTSELNENLIPQHWYDILVSDGLIKPGTYEERIKDAYDKLNSDMKKEINRRENEKAKMKAKGEKDSYTITDTDGLKKDIDRLSISYNTKSFDNFQPLVLVSKQIVVKEYFIEWLRKKRRGIYENK